MELSFDLRLLAIIGIYITLLLKSLKKNYIENIQKSIISEIGKNNEDFFSSAQKIIKIKTPTREKYFIKRRLDACTADYCASVWIRSISGISTICLVFCVFLLFAVIIYSIIKYGFIVDEIVLSSQLILFAIAILVWFAHKKHEITESFYCFLLLASWYGIIAITIGTVMAYANCGFSILPAQTAKYLFYAFFGIPLIPIIIAFFSTTILYLKTRRHYSLLKQSVEDQQSGKLKKQLKKTVSHQ